MEEFPDKAVDVGQLAHEIAPLNLPGFENGNVSVARLSRRQDSDGVWTAAPPYILVKCGPLNISQLIALQAIVMAHEPIPPVPPTDWRTEWGETVNTNQKLELIARRLGLE